MPSTIARVLCVIPALVLVACADAPTTAPHLDVATRSAAANAGGRPAVGVPFRGTFEASETGAFDPVSGLLVKQLSATGQASHLGRFTLSSTIRLNTTTLAATGDMTLTAADGSTLTATWVGQGAFGPDGVTIVETATITGGTGRFAGAGGSFVSTRLFQIATGLSVGSFEGTLVR